MKPEDESLWRILILDGHKSHINAQLIRTARRHKVWFVFLPAHLSHITQLLDVGVFSPLKTYFHQETRQYASLLATVAILKHRFFSAYMVASEKAFVSGNIKAGFRASGAYPVDLKRLLEKVVHTEQSLPPIQGPETPKDQAYNDEILWNTPSSAVDLEKQWKAVSDWTEAANRDVRTMVTKAGKKIDSQNAIIARLKLKNEYLTNKIASIEPK